MTTCSFHHAIVRLPGQNFADGLTTANLGKPNFAAALKQHADYCRALQTCGLELLTLEADPRFPDGVFVEDTAILTPGCAILTTPGADSRRGEVMAIRDVVSRYYTRIFTITPPGSLDGGDICAAGRHYFIGLSDRTNESGAGQLAEILVREGYTASLVSVHGAPGILHLKSGIAYLGDNRLALASAFADLSQFQSWQIVRVDPEESYAANCVRINDTLLVAQGYPRFAQTLSILGYHLITLDVSEFRKMDGGLSCLSLRF